MNPTPELTSLPYVPLRSIVSLLPLQQLISTFPRVHPRFTPIRASVLHCNQRLLLHIGDQKIISRRRRESPLSFPFAGHLVDSSTGALLYPHTYPSDFYRLRLDTLDSQIVEQLSTLMPAIAHLEVIVTQVELTLISHLANLLSLWASTLRTLKLKIGIVYCNGKWVGESATQLPSFRILFRVLNDNLTHLEHLTLQLQCINFPHPDEADSEPEIPLPVLGRLREFNFYSGDSPDTQAFILDALKRYATEKLTHIGLPGVIDFRPVDLSVLARHTLASRFTQLPFQLFLPFAQATAFCRSFPNLRECYFICDNLTSDEMMAGLGALSTLRNLQLLQCHSFPIDLPHLVANFAQMSPLKSLKVLSFSFRTKDKDSKQGHDRLVAPYWATLFPSVQIVRIAHGGRFCDTCYPDEDENSKKEIPDYAQVAPCLTQLFAPLMVLPSLRKIFHYRTRYGSRSTAEFTREGAFVQTHKYVL